MHGFKARRWQWTCPPISSIDVLDHSLHPFVFCFFCVNQAQKHPVRIVWWTSKTSKKSSARRFWGCSEKWQRVWGSSTAWAEVLQSRYIHRDHKNRGCGQFIKWITPNTSNLLSRVRAQFWSPHGWARDDGTPIRATFAGLQWYMLKGSFATDFHTLHGIRKDCSTEEPTQHEYCKVANWRPSPELLHQWHQQKGR